MQDYQPKHNSWDFIQFKKNSSIQHKKDTKQSQNTNPFTKALATSSRNPFFAALGLPVQTKLNIGQPNDPYEQEADRIADQIVSSSNPQTLQQKNNSKGIQAKNLASQVTPLSIDATQQKATMPELQSKAIQKFEQKDTASSSLESQINASKGQGKPMDADTQADMNNSFGKNLGNVRIHTDNKSVQMNQELGAKAFTVGNDIHFNQGEYNPSSTEGKRLLAHELVHTIQQGDTVKRQIQRRRVPQDDHLNSLMLDDTSHTGTSSRAGMARILSRAWASLPEDLRSQLTPRENDEEALRARLAGENKQTIIAFARDLQRIAPERILGDPRLIDTGPRPGTQDTNNLRTLYQNARAHMGQVIGGLRDRDLEEVFGRDHVSEAKKRYQRAAISLKSLYDHKQIVTDRSGYNKEALIGGLTIYNSQIALSPKVIDRPNDPISIITLIHESMHAGNREVVDKGYIGSPAFTTLSARIKLDNAAHYEVVFRRMLNTRNDYSGVTFIPAGTRNRGGGQAPQLSPQEQAIREASEMLRNAWTAALNLHSVYVDIYKAPESWDNHINPKKNYYSRYSNIIPYWSRVENLTIHARKKEIIPTRMGPQAVKPVTLIDLALSEGIIRKLSQAMGLVPRTPHVLNNLKDLCDLPPYNPSTGIKGERNNIIKALLKTSVTSITGPEARDEAMIHALASNKIFEPRSEHQFTY